MAKLGQRKKRGGKDSGATSVNESSMISSSLNEDYDDEKYMGEDRPSKFGFRENIAATTPMKSKSTHQMSKIDTFDS